MLDRARFDWIAEAEAKTDEALAVVKRVVDWFFATYEESSDENNATYDDCSDEWEFGCNGYCSTREGLDGYFVAEFATFYDAERAEILDAAVDEIEQGGCRSWTEKASPANVPLLRAHDHYWGRGHVHVFHEDEGKTLCGKTRETCPRRNGFRRQRRHRLQGLLARDQAERAAMKVARFYKGRESEVPTSWAEGEEMLAHAMGKYFDRRGGNLERMSVAARVAYGLFGERFLAADPTDALVYLLQEICRRRAAGLNGLEKPRRWHSIDEEEEEQS
jgi:hypothetical protein